VTLEIRKHGRVGAEILGVDLSRPLAEADFAAIRAAFAEHGVVFFRDQQITEEQHIAFARAWGRSTSTASLPRTRAIPKSRWW
jgi:taurine dioxygenase